MNGQCHGPVTSPLVKAGAVPTAQNAGWALETASQIWATEKCNGLAGNRTTIHELSSPLPSHYTD
jgi:hypothetical protein